MWAGFVTLVCGWLVPFVAVVAGWVCSCDARLVGVCGRTGEVGPRQPFLGTGAGAVVVDRVLSGALAIMLWGSTLLAITLASRGLAGAVDSRRPRAATAPDIGRATTNSLHVPGDGPRHLRRPGNARRTNAALRRRLARLAGFRHAIGRRLPLAPRQHADRRHRPLARRRRPLQRRARPRRTIPRRRCLRLANDVRLVRRDRPECSTADCCATPSTRPACRSTRSGRATDSASATCPSSSFTRLTTAWWAATTPTASRSRSSTTAAGCCLPGDLETPGLEDVIAELPYDCDVLMAPHHGSRRSDPPGFAAWSAPEWVVVSGGADSDADVERAYAAGGAKVLNTGKLGAIEFAIGGDGISVDSFRELAAQ